MATPDRGLRDKALNIINNVGQYGPLDATIDSYKQAADYADDARLYAEQALSGVSDLNTQIEKVTALANQVEDLNTEVSEVYTQVTTLDVDAVDGEAASAVYDKEENKIHFTLPKGKDGVDGDDGKSAYQSYLDTTSDNPKLSEADWILSLEGKDGKDGTNGKDGVNGTNGTNGTNGYSAYELAVIGGYTGTLEDFNEMNTKSLDRNQNLSELTNVVAARANLGVISSEEVSDEISAASSALQANINNKANRGANSDITALSGLTVALSVAQGGTGAKTASDARTNLGLGTVSTESVLPVSKGGTGSTSYFSTRKSLGVDGSENDPELIAHRGFGGIYPENTMIAFKSALVAGANSLETDISITSDGVRVLLHDTTVDRTSNGTGTITSLTSTYVRGLDFGSKFSSVYAGERIPLFADLLSFCKTKGVKLYPEIKNIRTIDDVNLIVSDIIAAKMESRVVVQAFDITHLQRLRTLNSDIPVGVLFSTVPTTSDYDAIQALGNAYLLLNFSVATSAVVSECVARGIKLSVWTVDKPSNKLAMNKIGINKLMSNYNLAGGS